jgi:hypothetical protein
MESLLLPAVRQPAVARYRAARLRHAGRLHIALDEAYA